MHYVSLPLKKKKKKLLHKFKTLSNNKYKQLNLQIMYYTIVILHYFKMGLGMQESATIVLLKGKSFWMVKAFTLVSSKF